MPASLETLLFEKPWPLVIALIAVTVAFLAVAKRSQKRSMVFASIASLGLAIGIVAMAQAYETVAEVVAARTTELVHSTGPWKEDAQAGRYDPQGFLVGPQGDRWMSLSDFFGQIRKYLSRRANVRHMIGEMDAEGSQRIGRSGFRIRTLVNTQMLDTQWLATWEHRHPDRGSDGWVMTQLKWVKVNGAEPTQPRW